MGGAKARGVRAARDEAGAEGRGGGGGSYAGDIKLHQHAGGRWGRFSGRRTRPRGTRVVLREVDGGGAADEANALRRGTRKPNARNYRRMDM